MTSLQLKRKAHGLFDLGHQFWGNLPQLPLQAGFDQRADPLHVHHGRRIQKRELADRDFVPTAAVLGGQRGT